MKKIRAFPSHGQSSIWTVIFTLWKNIVVRGVLMGERCFSNSNKRGKHRHRLGETLRTKTLKRYVDADWGDSLTPWKQSHFIQRQRNVKCFPWKNCENSRRGSEQIRVGVSYLGEIRRSDCHYHKGPLLGEYQHNASWLSRWLCPMSIKEVRIQIPSTPNSVFRTVFLQFLQFSLAMRIISLFFKIIQLAL